MALVYGLDSMSVKLIAAEGC